MPHSIQQIEEFVSEIDIEPVYEEIRKRLKLSNINFKKEIKNNRSDDPYIIIESENLSNYCGIMSTLFDEVSLVSFNSQVTEDHVNDKLGYYMTVHCQWHMKNGGENGTSFMSAEYRNEYWEFR